jgi:hypothetical protein
MEKRNVYRLSMGKSDGKSPLGRPRHRWLDNTITMDHVEVGWGDVNWIGLAQDRDRWRALVTTRDLSSSAQLHVVSNY